MTDAHTPAVLGHAPLTADMVPLLKPGSSVLLLGGKQFLFSHADALGVYVKDNGIFGALFEEFTYIGERDADGWIYAPEGGWTENLFGDARVVQVKPRAGMYETHNADDIDWNDVAAFRLSDQPAPTEGVTASGDGCGQCCYCDLGARELCRRYDLVPFGEGPERSVLDAAHQKPVAPSPISALGGTEAEGRSAPKPSEPTPVRGLAPVAWVHPDALFYITQGIEGRYRLVAGMCQEYTEPLYSASDVSALQGEVERLKLVIGNAGLALREYACCGLGTECLRSEDQCKAECGRIAGNALDAIAKAMEPQQ